MKNIIPVAVDRPLKIIPKSRPNIIDREVTGSQKSLVKWATGSQMIKPIRKQIVPKSIIYRVETQTSFRVAGY